jgi:ribosomal protein S18 acetylase RimI-like enzyme
MSDSRAPFVIRRATVTDLETVGRMGAQLLRVHYDFDRDRFMRPGSDAEEGYAWFLGSQLEAEDALILVAEREGKVVGYLYAGIEPRNWKELRERAGFVHDVLVDEPHRAHGIAEALMDEAFAWMRAQRAPRVLLWTAAPNERARRVFERLGFRSTMIEMTKELG